MNRLAMVATVAMGFLTAFVVGELALLVADADFDSPPTIAQRTQSEPVVEEFYAGVNAWLDSGDRTLERVIAPDFVDHTLSRAPDRNSAELFAYLSSIRTAVPSLRFEILEIESSGTIVSVDLLGVADPPSAIEGWSIALPPQPAFREILRIEGSQVVERWSSDDLWPSDWVEAERALSIGVGDFRQPSVQRFTLDPGSAFDLVVSGTVVLWVESGTLGVEQRGWDQTGALKFSTEPLSPGMIRIVEPTGELRVRALEDERVTLWTVSLNNILIPGGTAVSSSIQQDASASLTLRFSTNTARLSVLVVTLPPGATLSMSPAGLHAVSVVAGTLQAQPIAGDIFYCFGKTRSRLLSGPATALPGEGFINQHDALASYQVTGPDPATLVLMTVRPEAPSPSHPIRIGPA